MASKTASIPRFLLPQHGPLWRTTARTTARTPALYASKLTTRPTTPRSSSTKAGSAAAKAARASAPTKPKPKPKPQPQSQPPSQARTPPAEERPKDQDQERAHAQANDPSKPIVLAKPERFNPPSHGARLPRSTPKHYGGAPTVDEVKAQRARSYPGMPPPENTWSHWFINSRGVHLFITLGTLSGLAIYSFTASFRASSPFAHLIPPVSELPRHPLQYLGVCLDVVRLHEEHVSAQTAEKRRRKADDLAKRNEYRKAHGLDPVSGLWGARAEERQPTQEHPPAAPPPEADADAETGTETSAAAAVPAAVAGTDADGKRKKFWGIF